MIKGNRALGVLLGSGLLIVGGGSHSWAGEAKPGKAIYDKLCVSCHGADGKGNPAMTKAMGEKGLNIVSKDVQATKDDELIKVITEGKGKMPASGKNLTKQEQKDVLSYTRELAK